MTSPDTKQEELIEQCDRDAAADWVMSDLGGARRDVEDRIRSGVSYGSLSEAFARHRRLSQQPDERDEAARRAIAWLAAEQTTAEALSEGGGAKWGQMSVEQRIEFMGQRKEARDAAVLAARTALGASQ